MTISRAASRRISAAALIALSWALIALAWSPPTFLVQRYTGGHLSFSLVFVYVLLGFVPWMLGTPSLLWLAERFPISEGRVLSRLVLHVAAGVALIPLLTLAGAILSAVLVPAAPGQISLAALLNPTAITAFYSVPTYVAVIGIGQAIAYFARYRERERMLARAQLRALEAQLNPHFLFNTLNAISALGYRDPEAADRALTHLAELLRASLKERPEEITLKDEFAFANEYLDLYAIIMPGQIDFHWDIEPDAWCAGVPAMLLQPLIENAIRHGIAKLEIGGSIDFFARRRSGQLVLRIENPAPDAATVKPINGIGLSNACERLRVLYGEAGNLAFERRAHGVIVTIEIPFHEVPQS